MARRICIIDGHPDPDRGRFCHALAEAYAEGAQAGGHETRVLSVAALDFPLLRRAEEFAAAELPPDIAAAQEAIRWANHVVVIYPLWHGMLPALLKGFIEQVFRHGFAMDVKPTSWIGRLKGRSVRVVVTMNTPALFYRLYFRAHSLGALRLNILGFSGMRPVRASIVGRVLYIGDAGRRLWLERMRRLGAAAR